MIVIAAIAVVASPVWSAITSAAARETPITGPVLTCAKLAVSAKIVPFNAIGAGTVAGETVIAGGPVLAGARLAVGAKATFRTFFETSAIAFYAIFAWARLAGAKFAV